MKKLYILPILLILCFILFPVHSAFSQQQSNKNEQTSIAELKLPRTRGIIKARYLPDTGKDAPLIIHIQDAHTNVGAQNNIGQILTVLGKYNVSLFGVEGASGTVRTHLFSSYPDADARDEAASYFLHKGKLTGPEKLLITNPSMNVSLYGIEDRTLYLENLEYFRKSLFFKDENLQYLSKMHGLLEKLKQEYFSRELLSLEKGNKAFMAGKEQIDLYCKKLSVLMTEEGIDTDLFPTFLSFFDVMTTSDALDIKRAQQEHADFIQILSERISQSEMEPFLKEILLFRTGRRELVEHLLFLESIAGQYDEDITKYSQLFLLLTTKKTMQSIDMLSLLEEIELIHGTLTDALTLTDIDEKLVKIERDSILLEELVKLELSSDEYKQCVLEKPWEKITEYASELNKFARKISLPSKEFFLDESFQLKGISAFNGFYQTAVKRDTVFVDNLQRRMEEEDKKKGVLITGGFHTPGIMKALQEKGISYLVIMPHTTSASDSKTYSSLLQKIQTPFEQIISKAGFLAVTSFLAPLTQDPESAQELQTLFTTEFALLARAMSLKGVYEGSEGSSLEIQRSLAGIFDEWKKRAPEGPWKAIESCSFSDTVYAIGKSQYVIGFQRYADGRKKPFILRFSSREENDPIPAQVTVLDQGLTQDLQIDILDFSSFLAYLAENQPEEISQSIMSAFSAAIENDGFIPKPVISLKITDNEQAMATAAAKEIVRVIHEKNDRGEKTVLGLATGSTPIKVYEELIRMHRAKMINFSRVETFNLDEYVGISPSHHQSYRYFMDQNLFDSISKGLNDLKLRKAGLSLLSEESERELMRFARDNYRTRSELEEAFTSDMESLRNFPDIMQLMEMFDIPFEQGEITIILARIQGVVRMIRRLEDIRTSIQTLRSLQDLVLKDRPLSEGEIQKILEDIRKVVLTGVKSDGRLQKYIHESLEKILQEIRIDLSVNHLGIDKRNTFVLDGLQPDTEKECRFFEERIRDAGGIDLQLLGIGRNGHIAFNEPGSSQDSRTRLVELDDDTIQANSRFFASLHDVPTQAVSMGIGTILEAKKIVLLAHGEGKSHAIDHSLVGSKTSAVPASFLQEHADTLFIIDKAAGGLFMDAEQDRSREAVTKWIDILSRSGLTEVILPAPQESPGRLQDIKTGQDAIGESA